jgi:hypothetical protein
LVAGHRKPALLSFSPSGRIRLPCQGLCPRRRWRLDFALLELRGRRPPVLRSEFRCSCALTDFWAVCLGWRDRRCDLPVLRALRTALRALRTVLRALLTALRALLTVLRAPLTALRARHTVLRALRTALRAPLTVLRARNTALRAPLTALRALRTVLRALRTVLRAPLTVLRAPLTVLRAPLTVLRAPLTVLRARNTVLRALRTVLRAPLTVLRARNTGDTWLPSLPPAHQASTAPPRSPPAAKVFGSVYVSHGAGELWIHRGFTHRRQARTVFMSKAGA